MLVPPGDVDALAAAMQGLLSNPTKAREMGDAGRRRAASHFTWALSARKINDVLTALCRGAARV